MNQQEAPACNSWRDLIVLARPKQWAKSGFLVLGPLYGLASLPAEGLGAAAARMVGAVAAAFVAFALASSGCYVLNDILDRREDRAHPRKRHRPIASGRVSVRAGYAYMAALWVGAAACAALIPGDSSRLLLGTLLLAHVANVVAYSLWFKHAPVLDVVSLSAGFVLRVLAGCAAAAVEPSTWLLNCTFFISLFLALGKRLGERRTMGEQAAAARSVHSAYTDDLLRMSVVVTAVASLISYADYVQAVGDLRYVHGFNLLWLTMLPATYGLLRCMVLVERGDYDDPTELATRDRPFQASVVIFGIVTLAVIAAEKVDLIGG